MAFQAQLGSRAPCVSRPQRGAVRTQASVAQAPALAATKRIQLGDSDLLVSGPSPLDMYHRVMPCVHCMHASARTAQNLVPIKAQMY